MIVIKNLVKSYKNNIILDTINITINTNEILGLIGASGAGKSTLLRCINRLENFDSGEISIDGKNIHTLNAAELRNVRRNMGMIFQGFSLVNRKTVYDNIALPMKLYGYSKEDIHTKVTSLADIVGISDKLQERPSDLSGGQKQRIAIARALTLDPKYLLCDECTSALDPNNTTIILELLKELRKTLGLTIIIVTHEMEIVRRMCDRVAILENQKLASVSNVTELFLQKSEELNRFLGTPANSVTYAGSRVDLILKDTNTSSYFIYDISKLLHDKFKILDYYNLETNDGKFCKISVEISENDKKSLQEYLITNNIVFEVK